MKVAKISYWKFFNTQVITLQRDSGLSPFLGVISSLIAKSKLLILFYILQYEFWLYDHTKGFSRFICVLSLNKVNLAYWTKICLSWCLWVMEIEPMVDNEGIGHRLVRKKGIFKIAKFTCQNLTKIFNFSGFIKRYFPMFPTQSEGS